MSAQFKTNVKRSNIKLKGRNVVQIESPGLLNTFVRSKPHGLKKLRDLGPVSITKISIDNKGRINIKDAKFRKLVEQKLRAPGMAADTNYVCNNAYQCGKK